MYLYICMLYALLDNQSFFRLGYFRFTNRFYVISPEDLLAILGSDNFASAQQHMIKVSHTARMLANQWQ